MWSKSSFSKGANLFSKRRLLGLEIEKSEFRSFSFIRLPNTIFLCKCDFGWWKSDFSYAKITTKHTLNVKYHSWCLHIHSKLFNNPNLNNLIRLDSETIKLNTETISHEITGRRIKTFKAKNQEFQKSNHSRCSLACLLKNIMQRLFTFPMILTYNFRSIQIEQVDTSVMSR